MSAYFSIVENPQSTDAVIAAKPVGTATSEKWVCTQSTNYKQTQGLHLPAKTSALDTWQVCYKL